MEYKSHRSDDFGDIGERLKPEYLATGVHNVEVDADLAAKIGDAVFRDFYDKIDFSKMDLYVSYIEEEGVFIVSRMPKEPMAGGDFGLAIRKEDGAILKIWAGE